MSIFDPSVTWDAYVKRVGMIFHVVPLQHGRSHDLTNVCWCRPHLKTQSNGTIVIHIPEDGGNVLPQRGE